MRVYVASSWSNQEHPLFVKYLRDDGHQVYDYRNRAKNDSGFHWSEIDPDWELWTAEEYFSALDHWKAENGFFVDMQALKECDAVVAIQPIGVSASLELGWACGAGKITISVGKPKSPELMLKMCQFVVDRFERAARILRHNRPYDVSH